MKYFSSILFLLLFITSGNIGAKEIAENQSNIHLKLFSIDGFPMQAAGLQEGILDTQDTNEMDGFDGGILYQTTAIAPLKTTVNIKTEYIAVFIPVTIHSFFLDLPPPLLS